MAHITKAMDTAVGYQVQPSLCSSSVLLYYTHTIAHTNYSLTLRLTLAGNDHWKVGSRNYLLIELAKVYDNHPDLTKGQLGATRGVLTACADRTHPSTPRTSPTVDQPGVIVVKVDLQGRVFNC